MKSQKYFYIALIIISCVLLAIFVPRLIKNRNAKKQTIHALTSLAVDREIVDLGNVPQNVPAQAVFTLTNTGTNDLLITDVSPDCHCTEAEWDKKPVAPGKSTQIKTSYDSKAPGTFQKLVKVSANVPDSLVVLVLRGNVVPK